MKTTDYIQNWLKENLSDKRYIHSLSCAKCAAEFAKYYNQNEAKAYLAGLVHDCAKNYTTEDLIDIVQNKVKTGFDKTELKNPKTYHAIAGVYVAKKEFEIDDPEILQAIRYHTIGSVHMTLFDKIIYLADKIEPETRDKDFSRKLKNLIKKHKGTIGLDLAILKTYCETIKSLVKRNLYICPITIDVYNNLQEKVGELLED